MTRYGLPQMIRSDNGSPFVATNALLGLSRLSAWWVALGIGAASKHHEEIRKSRHKQAPNLKPPNAKAEFEIADREKIAELLGCTQ